MNKFIFALITGVFATASMTSFAASHGGAMKDPKAMEEKKAACKKMDAKTADDKMKAECKKMIEESKAAKK